jgi:ribosome-associated translation inhibitor RaiA
MTVPVQITYHGLSNSPALTALVKQRAARLRRVCPTIQRCRVVIDSPHQHQTHGRHYRVCVDLVIPGREIVYGRDPTEASANEDAYAAVAHAFDAVKRQLTSGAWRRG